jgi:hypothetical protein
MESTLDELLTRWRYHESLRSQRAPVPVLARSRRSLDQIRTEAQRLRQVLYPNGSEMESVAVAAHCDTLDTMVFFQYHEARPGRNGIEYPCPCGETVG